MDKRAQILGVLVIAVACVGMEWGYKDKSLFTPEAANSPLARSVFTFLESNRDQVIDEWIRLTEIPSPSGHEAKRAAYMQDQFQSASVGMLRQS